MLSRQLQLVEADVFHGRSGGVRNSFTYRTDLMLLPVETGIESGLRFLSRNKFNIWSLNDRHYGDGQTNLARRAEDLRERLGEPALELTPFLLTQPACLGFSFNPVSFWLFLDSAKRLRAVVSEVNNTSGDRHTYLCAHQDLQPISPTDRIRVRKIFHVSPFQPVDGDYTFSFRLDPDRVDIRIAYDSDTDDGLIATLIGPFRAVSDGRLIKSFVGLPFGAARVIALIYWQAIKLKLKGARFRSRPQPPAEDFST